MAGEVGRTSNRGRTERSSPDFVINDYRLFVPARMDSVSGYAQLDTGATSNMVARSVSDSFKNLGTSTMKGAFGELRTENVAIRSLRLLGSTFHGITARIQPDGPAGFRDLPFRAVMTAGVELLYRKEKRLHLDFRGNSVSLLEQSANVPSNRGLNSVQVFFLFPFRLASFQSEIGEAKLANTLFDTGAGWSVLNSRLLGNLEQSLKREKRVEATDPTGGRAKIPVFSHSDFRIGGASLGKTKFLAIDLTDVEKGLNSKVDFVLGLGSMLGRTWTIDPLNRKLEWR